MGEVYSGRAHRSPAQAGSPLTPFSPVGFPLQSFTQVISLKKNAPTSKSAKAK